MFGFGLTGYIAAGAAAIIITLGTLLYFQSNKVSSLEQNNAVLESIQETDKQVINNLQNSIQRSQEVTLQLQEDLQKAEKYGDDLRRKLNDHNLTKLSKEKPGLIETRVNNATQELFKEIESETNNRQ